MSSKVIGFSEVISDAHFGEECNKTPPLANDMRELYPLAPFGMNTHLRGRRADIGNYLIAAAAEDVSVDAAVVISLIRTRKHFSIRRRAKNNT